MSSRSDLISWAMRSRKSRQPRRRADGEGDEVGGGHLVLAVVVDGFDEVAAAARWWEEEPADGSSEAAGEGDDVGGVDVATPFGVVGLLDR